MVASSSRRSSWLAVDSVSDRLTHARSLQRMHAAFTEGRDVARGVRAVVAQSWERSAAAGIEPELHLPPIVMYEREIDARWHAHPLFPVLPVLRTLLSDATTAAGHMLVISDARGVLLWIEGHRRVIEATENMHLVCGADWSEAGAGTNALGTAVTVDHPVQIFSAEHFNRRVHPWQCSGAPIHDPETGDIVGVIDLTGHLKTAHPHTLSLVTAAAGMAEAFLREEVARRDAVLRERYLSRIAGHARPSALVTASGRVVMAVPHDWLGGARVAVPAGGGEVELGEGRAAVAEPLAGSEGALLLWESTAAAPRAAVAATSASGDVAVRLELLGRQPVAHVHGEPLPLSQRHAEILALLALNPRRLTAEQLALELYGERGKPVTVRAELSRLRALLAGAVLARPYRLARDVSVDFASVERALEGDDLASALERYPDALLPESEVELVVERRDRLDATIRRAVMAAGDTELLLRWCTDGSGTSDRQAAELLLSLLPPDDPAHPVAQAHVARLRRAA